MDSRIRRLFNKACTGYALLADGDKILLALSGGKDSLVMARLMAERARIFKPSISVEAVHVVMTNVPYVTDIAYLRDFCNGLGIKLNVLNTSFDETTDGRKTKCFLCARYRRKALFSFAKENGCTYAKDSKSDKYRKVVASPKPLKVTNIDIVKQLALDGNIVVTVGGGGIPVVEENGVKGVEAVIDKDLASALTAVEIGADEFYILTDVPKVYINFRQPGEMALDVITVKQAEEYLEQGQFGEGSMAPKVRAALHFVKNGGKECIITEAGQLGNANCGTRIIW